MNVKLTFQNIVSGKMSKIDDGGQAFPRAAVCSASAIDESGMSLRDWLVGQVLMGVCANNNRITHPRDQLHYISNAYEWADRIIAYKRATENEQS